MSLSNIITGSILSSDHIIELLQLVETLRYTLPTTKLRLIMPYCAFSRQDRRCNRGESFSLKVFTSLINSCKFESVTTYDNHSDVSTALLNNCRNVPVADILYKTVQDNFCNIVGYPPYGYDFSDHDYDFYISPDAGANKKVLGCSKQFQVPMIRADKSRDLLTGNITHTEVFTTAEQLNNKTVLIIDDICAGGRTFIELAKALKRIQPNVIIHIYVTHGFFEYGLDELTKAGISKFITTDSVCTLEDSSLTIIKI